MSVLADEQVLRIRRLAQEGAFASEEAALDEALDLLEREVELLRLRAQVEISRAQVIEGRSSLVTAEWLAERAEMAKARYLARTASPGSRG